MPLAGPGWYVDTSVLHNPGEPVHRYTAEFMTYVLTEAIARCPVGERWFGPTRGAYGRMRMMHDGDISRTSLAVSTIEVSNSAPYAVYVHQGTREYIEPNSAPYFLFSVGGRLVRANSVTGQDPQPWLEDAMSAGMRRFAR